MAIKTEKVKITLTRLKIWIPKHITEKEVYNLLKENRIMAYHMWTRDPMYVSILYKNKAELDKAKSFAKLLEQLGNERE